MRVPPSSQKDKFYIRLRLALSRTNSCQDSPREGGCYPRRMRRGLRPVLALALAIALLGVFAAGLAAVLDTPRARPGAPRAERLFVTLCAECHGADGRGSSRAALFLIRPGDLTDPSRTGRESDQY